VAEPPRPLLSSIAVPNITAHWRTDSVLLYNGPLLCGFNVPIKGLRLIMMYCVRRSANGRRDG